MRNPALIAVCGLLWSCSSRTTQVTPLLYDTCFSVADCIEGATLCEGLAVEFAGLEYQNAICTTECVAEGPVSPDCSRALIGRAGSCYPASVAGGFDGQPVCFEPCNGTLDCLVGFRCLGALDLCGADATCPIPRGDAICVPGPD